MASTSAPQPPSQSLPPIVISRLPPFLAFLRLWALRSPIHFAVVEVVPVICVNDLVDEEHTDWLFVAHDPPEMREP
jgi:hypothetical protein